MFIGSCSCVCPLSGYYWEMSVSLFFIFPIAYLHSWITSFLNLLFSRLNSSSSQPLLTHKTFHAFNPPCGLLLHSLHCVYIYFFFFNGKPRTDPSTPDKSHQGWAKRKDHFLGLLVMFCLMQSRLLVAFIATRAQYRFMVDMLSTWIERSSLSGFFQAILQSACTSTRLIPPQVEDFAFPFAELCAFFSVPFSILLRLLQMMTQSSGYKALLPALNHLQTGWGHTLSHHSDH